MVRPSAAEIHSVSREHLWTPVARADSWLEMVAGEDSGSMLHFTTPLVVGDLLIRLHTVFVLLSSRWVPSSLPFLECAGPPLGRLGAPESVLCPLPRVGRAVGCGIRPSRCVGP